MYCFRNSCVNWIYVKKLSVRYSIVYKQIMRINVEEACVKKIVSQKEQRKNLTWSTLRSCWILFTWFFNRGTESKEYAFNIMAKEQMLSKRDVLVGNMNLLITTPCMIQIEKMSSLKTSSGQSRIIIDSRFEKEWCATVKKYSTRAQRMISQNKSE